MDSSQSYQKVFSLLYKDCQNGRKCQWELWYCPYMQCNIFTIKKLYMDYMQYRQPYVWELSSSSVPNHILLVNPQQCWTVLKREILWPKKEESYKNFPSVCQELFTDMTVQNNLAQIHNLPWCVCSKGLQRITLFTFFQKKAVLAHRLRHVITELHPGKL